MSLYNISLIVHSLYYSLRKLLRYEGRRNPPFDEVDWIAGNFMVVLKDLLPRSFRSDHSFV
jgi:hypothetical protein